MLNLETLAARPTTTAPFPHLTAEGLLSDADKAALPPIFPEEKKTGFFPVEQLTYGPAFEKLLSDDVRSPEFSRIVGEKLDRDLVNRPQMIVVRKWSALKDGNPHTDGMDKVATALVYLNDDWSDKGGALRFPGRSRPRRSRHRSRSRPATAPSPPSPGRRTAGTATSLSPANGGCCRCSGWWTRPPPSGRTSGTSAPISSSLSGRTDGELELPPRKDDLTGMATVIDTRAFRHPEKRERPESVVLRKPDWLRVRAPGSAGYNETRAIVKAHGLTTVCEEAACPNIGECWTVKHATMMIMGEVCTRACAFCNVTTGRPDSLDPTEPERVASAVAKMGLKHVVITSVDRDDLEDGGAGHFAAVVRAIRAATPETTIEILTPDFLRKPVSAAETIIDAHARRVQPQP